MLTLHVLNCPATCVPVAIPAALKVAGTKVRETPSVTESVTPLVDVVLTWKEAVVTA
jgi:hypothetical protein